MNKIYCLESLVGSIACSVCGNESARICFLLIHGAGSSFQTWNRSIEILSQISLLISPDLRSHGLSADSSDMSLSSIVYDIGICTTRICILFYF